MPEAALVEHLALVLVTILALILAFLYRGESQKRRQFLALHPREVLRETESQSRNIILKALKKAQGILGRAEEERLKAVADGKSETKELESQYAKQMLELFKELESGFSQHISLAEQAYIKYLEGLRFKGEKAQAASEEFTKQRSTEILSRFETNLKAFLQQTESQSMGAINQEIKASRVLIDRYKQQQLAIIDENVIAMLERTLSLVLTKKITLEDELDLVYEALDQAKSEKFIV